MDFSHRTYVQVDGPSRTGPLPPREFGGPEQLDFLFPRHGAAGGGERDRRAEGCVLSDGRASRVPPCPTGSVDNLPPETRVDRHSGTSPLTGGSDLRTDHSATHTYTLLRGLFSVVKLGDVLVSSRRNPHKCDNVSTGVVGCALGLGARAGDVGQGGRWRYSDRGRGAGWEGEVLETGPRSTLTLPVSTHRPEK